jgi:hypothetical protein
LGNNRGSSLLCFPHAVYFLECFMTMGDVLVHTADNYACTATVKSLYVLRAWCKEMYNIGVMNNCTRLLCTVNDSLYWRVFSSTLYLRLDKPSVSYRILSLNKVLIIRPNTTYRFSII